MVAISQSVSYTICTSAKVVRFAQYEHEKLRFTLTDPEVVTGFAATGCVDFEVSEALFG